MIPNCPSPRPAGLTAKDPLLGIVDGGGGKTGGIREKTGQSPYFLGFKSSIRDEGERGGEEKLRDDKDQRISQLGCLCPFVFLLRFETNIHLWPH